MSRPLHLIRLLLAVALLAAGAVALPSAAAAPEQSCAERRGPWTSTTTPQDSTGALPHVLAVVRETGRTYAATHATVWRSDDLGCTWQAVLQAPVTAGVPTRVVHLAVGERAADGDIVHVLLQEDPVGSTSVGGGSFDGFTPYPLRLLSSDDAGVTWRSPLTPLPASLRVAERAHCGDGVAGCQLVVAPSDPSVVYLAASPQPIGAPPVLLRSADGGRTFVSRSPPNETARADGGTVQLLYTDWDEIAVDPRDPNVVWGQTGPSSFSVSRDGGAVWKFVDTGYTFSTPQLDLHAPAAGGPTRLVTVHSGGRDAQVVRFGRSDDDGASWTSREPAEVGLADEATITGLATGARPDDIVLTRAEEPTLLGYSAPQDRFVDLDPGQLIGRTGVAHEVQVAAGAGPVVLAEGVLLVYRGPLGQDLTAQTRTVVVGQPPAGGGTPVSSCPALRSGAGWTVVDPPVLPVRPVSGSTTSAAERDAALLAVSADPARPQVLYATNGYALARTEDGGCTWTVVYALPVAAADDSRLSAVTSTIVDVVVSPGAGGRTSLLVLSGNLAQAQRPVVVISEDGVTGWTTRTSGLPQVSDSACPGPPEEPEGCALVAAPSDPDRLYLTVSGERPLDNVGVLLASEDGGRTWDRRANPDAFVASGSGVVARNQFRQLRVDPADADRLFAVVNDLLWRSDDAGRTWSQLELPRPVKALTGLAVSAEAGAATRVRTFEPDAFASSAALLASDDGGRTVRVERATGTGAGAVTSVASAQAGEAVLTQADRTYVHLEREDLFVEVTLRQAPGGGLTAGASAEGPGLLGALRGAQVTGPDAYLLWGPAMIALLRPTEVGTVQAVLEPPSSLTVPPLLPPLPAALTPARQVVDLAVGQRRTVPYSLDLPPRPVPLDVMLLLDSSGSMADDIRGLRLGLSRLVERLAASRVDVRIGVAHFRSRDVRYQLLHQLAVPDDELLRVLSTLRTGGGDETHYTALHQVATGSGIAPVAVGAPVRPGQGAAWRDRALRFVVHATDENLQLDESGPDPLTAVQALVDEQVRHIGLAADPSQVEGGLVDPSVTRAQMRQISTATGALAPPSGVDCDGDGSTDLRAGEPLVCPIPPGATAPDLVTPLLEILLGVTEPAQVALSGDDGGIGVLQGVAARQPVDAVDVTRRQELGFDVTVGCTGALAGRELPVDLTATVREVPETTGTLLVRCGVPPVPGLPGAPEPPAEPPAAVTLPVAPPQQTVAGLPLLVPPAPPVLAVPAPAAAPAAGSAAAGAASSAASGASGAIGQPGAATSPDEEEQVSLASALADREHQQGLAFSARSAVTSETAARLVGAGLLTALTASVLARRPARRRQELR